MAEILWGAIPTGIAGATSLHRCPFTGNLPQHLPSCSNIKGLNLSRIMWILVVLLWLESRPRGRLRDYDFLVGHKEALNLSDWIFSLLRSSGGLGRKTLWFKCHPCSCSLASGQVTEPYLSLISTNQSCSELHLSAPQLSAPSVPPFIHASIINTCPCLMKHYCFGLIVL